MKKTKKKHKAETYSENQMLDVVSGFTYEIFKLENKLNKAKAILCAYFPTITNENIRQEIMDIFK